MVCLSFCLKCCGFCGNTLVVLHGPIASMFTNPVSICMISLAVDVGVFRILFMILSSIICMCFISFLVVVHVSVAYSSVGIRRIFQFC